MVWRTGLATHIFTMAILLFNLFPAHAVAQGGVGAPFLQVSPSPAANGMGGAGVAFSPRDPFSSYFNPAHLGSGEHSSAVETFLVPITSELEFNFASELTGFGFRFGLDLEQAMDGIPLYVGAAFIVQSIEAGPFVQTGPDGRVLGTGFIDEGARSISLGAGMDLGVHLSVGTTIKFIDSKFPDLAVNASEANATAFDFGIKADVPLLDIVSDVSSSSFALGENLSPDLDVGLGFALSNLGGELEYDNDSDPLPRTARLGYHINAGLDYTFAETTIRILDLAWTLEVEDLLVTRDSMGFEYEPVLSDVDILDNVLLAKKSVSSDNRRGWRLEIGEVLLISGGQYTFGLGAQYETFSTSGFGIRARGLFKLISILSDSAVFDYLGSHIDMRYLSSHYNTDLPDDIRKYSGVTLSYYDFL